MKRAKSRVRQYTALFEANEHGGYTVTIRALPGLVTEGKNLEHARLMAKDSVRCYIEGLRKKRKRASLSNSETRRRR
jgi:predicted RNase H-like HicB family nuclease